MELFQLLLALFATAIVAVVSAIFLLYSSRNKRTKDIAVLFIDAPDPDNPAAAVALYKHVLLQQSVTDDTSRRLHIVLTGRPVDLRTAKEPNDEEQNIVRKDWERNNPDHAHKLLQDSAARIHNYLVKSNVPPGDIAIYDGGVAPSAPLSDVMHDWDFLFDRQDLVEGSCHAPKGQGEVPSLSEYDTLVTRLNQLSPEEREREILSFLRPFPLLPLDQLKCQLQSNSYESVTIFLGGPATALVQLFSSSSLRNKVVGVYGMFGSLKPGVVTLLPNQFNVACDVGAASRVFVNNLFPRADKYLVATETAKNEVFKVSAEDLLKAGAPPYFVGLQRLWEGTHGGRVQPLFDVLPVMTYLDKYETCFNWNGKKAVLFEVERKGSKQQLFRYVDSDNDDHVMVSDDAVQGLTKQQFIEFVCKAWS